MGNQQNTEQKQIKKYCQQLKQQKQQKNLQKQELFENEFSCFKIDLLKIIECNDIDTSQIKNIPWLAFLIGRCLDMQNKYPWCSSIPKKLCNKDLQNKLLSNQHKDLKGIQLIFMEYKQLDILSKKADLQNYKENSTFINEVRFSTLQNNISSVQQNNSKQKQQNQTQNNSGQKDSISQQYSLGIVSEEQYEYQTQYKQQFLNQNDSYQPEFMQNDHNGFKKAVDQTILFFEDVQSAVFKKKVNNFKQDKKYQQQLQQQNKNLQIVNQNNPKKSFSTTYSSTRFSKSVFQDEQNSEEDYNYGLDMIQFFKKLTEVIEFQIMQKNSPLRSIIKLFKTSVNTRYIKKLNDFYDDDLDIQFMKDNLKELTIELNDFIKILYQMISLYYNLQELSKIPQAGLLTVDNIINFCTTLLFDDSMYTLVFEFFKVVQDKNTEILQQKILILQNLTPQDLGVRQELCLNSYIIKHILEQKKKKQKKQKENNNNMQDIKEEEELKSSENIDKSQNKKQKLIISDEQLKKDLIIKNLKFNNLENDNNCNENDYKNEQNNDNENTRQFSSLNQLNTQFENQNFQQNAGSEKKPQNQSDLRDNFKKQNKMQKYNIIDTELTEARQTFHNLESDAYNIQKSNIEDDSFHNNFNQLEEILEKIPQPYSFSLEQLKTISFLKSPIHKLKLLVSCIQTIHDEIDYFYNFINQKLSIEDQQDEIHIESDDLISILVYIVINAQMPNCGTHFRFIETFLSPNLQNSISGYHLMNFQVATKYLEDFDVSKFKISLQQQEKQIEI